MRGDEAANNFTIQTEEDDGTAYVCVAVIHKKSRIIFFFVFVLEKKIFVSYIYSKRVRLSSAEGNARGICRKRSRKQEKLFF